MKILPLSSFERVYIVLAAAGVALAVSEWYKPTVPSGLWAGPHILARQIFGESAGTIALYLLLAVLFLAKLLRSIWARSKGSTK